MRPSYLLFVFLCALLSFDLYLHWENVQEKNNQRADLFEMQKLVKGLGLSDLAVSTEARYTRHPAVSDPLVPFMDHPGAMEHFPSGTFWIPQSSP